MIALVEVLVLVVKKSYEKVAVYGGGGKLCTAQGIPLGTYWQ